MANTEKVWHRKYSVSAGTRSLLEDLRRARRRGRSVSRQKYREAMEKAILEEESVGLGFANGTAILGGDIGFVSKALPPRAKLFVRRHELEHLLQTGSERNAEFSANFAAAKEYFWGGLQTIMFTIRYRARFFATKSRYVAYLWGEFKKYFLPFR